MLPVYRHPWVSLPFSCVSCSPSWQGIIQAKRFRKYTRPSRTHYRGPSRAEVTTNALVRSAVAFDTYAMASVSPETTGLPMAIYISPKNAGHGPLIKVLQQYGDRLNRDELFSVTIEDDPRVIGKPGKIRLSDLARIRTFIQLNKEVLLMYWEQKEPVYTLQFLQALQKIKE